jgi:hypothetical protein
MINAISVKIPIHSNLLKAINNAQSPMSDQRVTLDHPLISPRKAKWTAEEDEQLRVAVRLCGTESWNRVAMRIPTRTGKQCRERWIGQLAPTVIKDVWLPEEDTILIRSHTATGNRWTAIAAHLPGRSALSIKNRWHWLVRHKSSHELDADLGTTRVFDIVERRKPVHAVFEPLELDDRQFGAAFEEFRAKMLMGGNYRMN